MQIFHLVQNNHHHRDDQLPMNFLQTSVGGKVVTSLVEIVRDEVNVDTTNAQVVPKDEEIHNDAEDETEGKQ